jgi:hypothetical protein
MKIRNPFSRKSAPKPAPLTTEEWAQKVLDDIATPLVYRALREARQNAK